MDTYRADTYALALPIVVCCKGRNYVGSSSPSYLPILTM